MKNKIFIIVAIACMAFSAPTSALADGELEQVDLEVSIWDSTTQKGGIRRSPVQIPTVFLDGFTLYFDEPCDDCTIQLLDEDE